MKNKRLYPFLALVFYTMAGTFYQVTAQTGPPQQAVSGTVTDALGPITGVNVILHNQNNGTFTDREGQYSLMASPADTLVFTYLGYKTVTMPVGNRTQIDVRLQEEATALQEVEVNAGYYTVKERERTGSISRVTAAEIEKQPVSNPLAALEGRVTGLQIIQQTGVPGGDFDIRIRGTNSLRSDGNDPLYVIDGVPFPSISIKDSRVSSPSGTSNPLNNINPLDIASIEILKDADATAIYGSRGANGVVLITTKKGRMGDVQFNLHMQTGTARVSNKMDLLNTAQYLEMREEAFANDNITPTPANAPDLMVWNRNRYTDWQDQLMGGTAFINNVQASLSGGNERTTFRAGGGFRKETTVFPGNFGNKKASGLLNLNHSSNDNRFKFSITTSFVHDHYDLMSGLLVFPALRLPPNAPALYDDNGNLNWENNTWNNPLAELNKKYQSNTENLIVNTNLSYELARDLILRTDFGYNVMNVHEFQYTPLSSIRPSYAAYIPRSANENNSSIKTWIVEPQLEYQRVFRKGKFSVLVGGTFQETINHSLVVNATGFNSDALLENLQAASDIRIFDDRETEYRYRALYARINYNHDQRYFLNLTGRRDGSSRFGPGKQYASFGAIGAAWIFSNEKFFENSSFLSYGKLRGSYGTTGNDQIGDYEYLNLWAPTSVPYQNISGLIPSRLYNPEFGWETNTKFEMAIDVGFLRDHILLNVSYFLNRSGDQLVGFPLPGTTGFTSIQSNLPATVQNTGFEFELNTKNFDTNKFKWNTSANLSILKNKLLEFPDLEDSPFANVYHIGKPLTVVTGFRYVGVDPVSGIYVFEDVNEDGIISFPNDLEVVGDLAVDFFGGIQNTLRLEKWELGFFVQFVKQMGKTIATTFDPPGLQTNQPVEVLNRWQSEGDATDIQKYVSTYNDGAFRYFDTFSSDFTLTDASFIRLRSISLSYDMPIQSKRNIGLRYYIQGQNLLTMTKYKGLDPENPGASHLPNLRQYTLGLKLTF